MVTRKEKRDREKNTNYFFELGKIKNHFFENLEKRLNNIDDPRHQSYVTYNSDILLMMTIFKNVFDLKSMRYMTDQLNKDECIHNFRKILGIPDLEELPHHDTINDFLSRLDPAELEKIRTYMIKALLTKRCFDDYRINGKYWGIIIDGTGLYSFQEKHCDHCLRREYTDRETGKKNTIYMHHVLEAKLVVGDMVLSIASEFIENESEDVSKQDCELNAFYRLADKIKQTFKRLPICIIADSLYACEGVFQECDARHWKYMIRFKEGRIRSVAQEFQDIKMMENLPGDTCWVNDITYKERTLNVLESSLNTGKQPKTFTFITNIKVTKRNVDKLVASGRSRWKIENQGFNAQKNIRYHIEHASSRNYLAMKNHYLLTQIADILMQLFERGSEILKSFKKTAREISSILLEAIRSHTLTDEDIQQLAKPRQIRFT